MSPRQSYLLGDVPCLGPPQIVLVHEQPHEFSNANGGVCIVELEGDLIGELFKIGVQLLVPPHNILQAQKLDTHYGNLREHATTAPLMLPCSTAPQQTTMLRRQSTDHSFCLVFEARWEGETVSNSLTQVLPEYTCRALSSFGRRFAFAPCQKHTRASLRPNISTSWPVKGCRAPNQVPHDDRQK